MVVRRFRDLKALIEDAAGRVIHKMHNAIERQGYFTFCLSGGGTPRPLYERLADSRIADDIPWDRVHLFWGDERAVPLNHPDSNYGMVRTVLLEKIRIPPRNIHRMEGEIHPPAMGADLYERELLDTFRILSGQEHPNFDLTLLGLGSDGHIASLFPGSPVLKEADRLVSDVEAPTHIKPCVPRLTLTLTALNASRSVFFLVSGLSKREVVKKILVETTGVKMNAAKVSPAALIDPAGEITWFLDRGADPGPMDSAAPLPGE